VASDLLCFSHLRWEFVWQRPQHLMTRAARSRRVWFIEEPAEVDREPCLEIRPVADNLTVMVPQLPSGTPRHSAVRTQLSLLRHWFEPRLSSAPLHWYYTPLARSFAASLPSSAIVYDCMDELSAFAGAPPSLRVWESELLAAADVVFAGGTSLYEAKRLRHPNVHAFPSSVDAAHFAKARGPRTDPEPQRAIPRPRIGFIGVLDERLDRELIAAIARLRPAYSFVFVGPTAKIDVADLPQAPNLHYLGMQPYELLPDFLAHWDVAILPFARNEATRYISPTKTPEYLAAGRPVVSTSIRDVVHPYGDRALVQIADDPAEFVACLDRALQAPDALWRARVDDFLKGLSWDATWSAMHERVQQAERCRPERWLAGGATRTANAAIAAARQVR
jgi:glycosyltransferase involved in cell wall biosynthesis